MNRRLLILVTAPAVVLGFVLSGACLVSAWHVNRLQTDVARMLAQNLSSLECAQQLENNVRQLRFHSFLYLLDPDTSLLTPIREYENQFEHWLARAIEVGTTDEEKRVLSAIRQGYELYERELELLREEVARDGPRRDARELTRKHPLRHVTDSCHEFAAINGREIMSTSAEIQTVSRQLHGLLLFLALGGPLGGLIGGYGIARGLSRSICRLSVHVNDVVQHLDQNVTTMQLTPGDNLRQLDSQLKLVVQRVAEVAERLQRQQREVLRAQQFSALGQLAAGVAHEVRNPLTSIKLLVEASLRPSNPRPLTQENLHVVHQEIVRLEECVQGLLDFARPPSLVCTKQPIGPIILRAINLVRARAHQQQVCIELPEHQSEFWAEVDASQLCSVLVNLFINALDAMPTGGILGVTVEHAATQSVFIRVNDSGSGISDEVISQLFSPFVSTKPTGSGLGLSTSRRIIEEHGGCLSGGNAPQGGACFVVQLPTLVLEENHAFATSG